MCGIEQLHPKVPAELNVLPLPQLQSAGKTVTLNGPTLEDGKLFSGLITPQKAWQKKS